MKQNHLFILWGGLFPVCAGLGLLPEPSGGTALALRGISLLFFACPAVLVYRAAREKNRHTLLLVRNLSAASLGLTLGLLVANLLAAPGPELLGTALYYMLVIVSAPMVASGHWALSLFLWACLLLSAQRELKS